MRFPVTVLALSLLLVLILTLATAPRAALYDKGPLAGASAATVDPPRVSIGKSAFYSALGL